jgi:hypothetical protein
MDEIVFEKTDYNFGVIGAENGIKTVVYTFTNTSANPFIIDGLEAACGCTNLRSNKEIYPAGDIGTITVEFNPKNISGKTSKWVYIRGNYSDGFQKDLSFKAEVVSLADNSPDRYYKGEFGYLMMDVNNFAWGKKLKNQVLIDTIKLFNDGYSDIVISSAKSSVPFISVENLPITLAVDSWSYIVVKADLYDLDTIGSYSGNIQLQTNDRFFPKKEFPVYIDLLQNFSELKKRHIKKAARLTLSTNQLLMGEISGGGIRTKSIVLKNTGKSDLTIRKIDSDCSCTVVSPTKHILIPGEEITLKVTFDAVNKSGPQGKVVTVITNDPVNPRQTFVVKSVVK